MHDPNPTPLLTVHTHNVGDAMVVTATGEIDLNSVPVLERALRDILIKDPETVVVVDLSTVSFLGSTGIAVLLTVAQSCRQPLRLVPSYPARRPLEVTGAAELFIMCDNLDTATEPVKNRASTIPEP
ncbi:anti-sigma factor antagonist [Nocardia yunnanensis]|uniref:Anti-sigma factor antagonist n=1 Tax=Nocardia yunnanensis TaxID=2382165 RepID=A0A386ZJY3_9NOCA|nr:STAS domain-containing protein [Nocardia yunnanensis]AYF77746.1 anti-sigma factor antagonist [Nocardia yunnanensis]